MVSTRKLLWTFPFAGLVICLSLSSCILGASRKDTVGDLVEKSRLVPPAWLAQELNQFVANGSFLQHFVVKKNQSNLTLGIRQSREFAISAGEMALVVQIKDSLQKLPGAADLTAKGFPWGRLEALIVQELDLQKEALLTVSDIYYEKWKNRESSMVEMGYSEVFSVYVLVSADKGKIAEFTYKLSDKFQASLYPEIQHLGTIIKNSSDASTAH